MTVADMRHMTVSEIENHIRANKKMLANKVFNHHITPIENPASIKSVRKEIAQLNTILTELNSRSGTQETI